MAKVSFVRIPAVGVGWIVLGHPDIVGIWQQASWHVEVQVVLVINLKNEKKENSR